MGVGGAFVSHSWEGTTYVFLDDFDERIPAAVGKGIDFSALKGSALSLASQKRLIEEARMIAQADSVGVELGHFIIPMENGKKQLACRKYSLVNLTFSAEGVAVNGESPQMQVQGACKVGETISKISPIWIPYQKLLNEQPANMELVVNDPYKVSFRFDHMGSFWPTSWFLQSISLESRETGEVLEISTEQLKDMRPVSLKMSWKDVSEKTE